MKISFVTFIIYFFVLAPASDIFSQDWKTHNTRINKNALDVSISVKYPSYYQYFPQHRGKLIASFEKYDQYSNIIRTLQITVQGDNASFVDKTFNSLFGKTENYDVCTYDISQIPKNPPSKVAQITTNSTEKKTYGGICGLLSKNTMKAVVNGEPMVIEQDVFYFGYLNKTVDYPRFVSLNCNTGGLESMMSSVTYAHQSDSTGLCVEYFNSLQIHDR
jgi:hypothetical protein